MKLLYLLIPIILLSACSKSFVVVGNIPTPLIDRSTLNAKVKYSDKFRNYKYIESSDKRALENVEFGNAQVGLFDRIFSGIFNLVGDNEEDIDINIEPSVLDFQYSVPSETKSTQYEVWLKYRIRVSDNKNGEIADWVVKGYGKTPDSLLVSHLKLFNKASNIALRDVGAQLAIGFRSQPSIEDFLNKAIKFSEIKNNKLNETNLQTKPNASEPNSESE